MHLRVIENHQVDDLVHGAMEVLKTLGCGLQTEAYENALVTECHLRCIPVNQQPRFDVIYKDHKVGECVPDLICFDTIVVHTRTIEQITDSELTQIFNDLKITGRPGGLILNFKHPVLEWKRVDS